MFERQLSYLIALAQQRHFGRAAEACHVSQPTLSAGIRKLEEELGAPLVIRGHRFLGLTPEGERVLQWAQRIVLDYDSLKQDLRGGGQGLSGKLRLAAIPASLPAIPMLTVPFTAEHPNVSVQIESLNSIAIQRGLDDMAIDAGVTYLENEPLIRVRRLPLYDEHYVFVGPADALAGDRHTIPWREAAAYPLCLLTPDMQNRRIVNQVLHELGLEADVRVESNSFASILALARSGPFFSIVPHGYMNIYGPLDGMRPLALVDPVRTHAVGLVVSDLEPAAPVAAALSTLAGSLAPAIGEAMRPAALQRT